MHLKKQREIFAKAFLVFALLLSVFTFRVPSAYAIYQNLQENSPASTNLFASLDNGSTANNTVTLSGTVQGAEYTYDNNCRAGINDPGYLENGASYVGGATTGSLTQTQAGNPGTGGSCLSQETPPQKFQYSFSGTIDVSNYSEGSHTVTITFSTPGIQGSGNNMPAYNFSDTETFTVSHKAAVSVALGTCPSATQWTTSNGYSGTGAGSFSFTPSAGGDNVSITADPGTGYVYNGSSPNSQLMTSGGSYRFTFDCRASQQAPAVTLTSNPAQISCNQTATLTWSATNAASCGHINGLDQTGNPTSGSVSGISPGIYQIQCTGPGGTGTGVVNNNAGGSCGSGSSVTVTANPTSISSGNSSTVSWSATGVMSCASNWWSSGTTISGSNTVNPVVTTTYTKTCADNNGNSYSGSATVTVTAPPASSTIVVNNNTGGSWTINPGSSSGSGSQSVNVSPSNSGTSYTITPASVNGYNYPPTITNSAGSGSSMTLFSGQSGTFTLNYTSSGGGAFDYSLSNSSPVTIKQGQSGQVTVTETLTSGTSQPVTLSLSGNSTGVSSNYSSCYPASPTCTSTITFTLSSNAPVGHQSIVVTGSPVGRTTTIDLNVSTNPTITLSCVATPATALVGNTVNWSTGPSGVKGGTPPYTYLWTGPGFPTDSRITQPSFNMTYSTVGHKTGQLTVTDSNNTSVSCSPPGDLQINFNPKYQEF